MKIQDIIPEGSYVKKGDFIAELDRSELTTKIAEAENNLERLETEFLEAQLDTSLTLSKARDQLIRLRALMEQAILRKSESIYEPKSAQRQADLALQDAERAYALEQNNFQTVIDQAVIKMKQAARDLLYAKQSFDKLRDLSADFTVVSPDSGMLVYQRDRRGQLLTIGGTVNSWDPIIATLPDFSVMESITFINEVDIEKVRVGQSVDVGLDAHRDRLMKGVVTQVANIGEQTGNQEGVVFRVTIEIADTSNMLRPAMTTNNTITIAELPDALFLPLESIHTEDSLTFVYVKNGNNVYRHPVELGLINENEVEVRRGLDTADYVFLSLPQNDDALPLFPNR